MVDFHGVYHSNRVAHQFPIPGTAIAVEKRRSDFYSKRRLVLDEEVSKIVTRHQKSAKVKERKTRLENNLVFQAKVGDMLRRVERHIEDAAEVINGPKAPADIVIDGHKVPNNKENKGAATGEEDGEAAATSGEDSSQKPSPRQPAGSSSSSFSPEYVPSFWRLVKTGKSIHVANYLSTGFPHIDGREEKMGDTVLMYAVKHGDVEMVETLLKFKAR